MAERLRETDKKKWTQKALGAVFGVRRQLVSDWLRTNAESGKASKPKPDARVKVDPKAKPLIAARVAAGEAQAQVAADLGFARQKPSTPLFRSARKAPLPRPADGYRANYQRFTTR